nr:reverse transcriptase domain-containing protein [Tanacetum cinerariifolium]
MLLVTQIDTFYNGLTLSHKDINAVAGGTFMQKTSEECYELIENMTAHHNHWDTSVIRDETSRNISSTSTTESPEVVRQVEMMNKNFLEMMRQIHTIKIVETKCETYGGPYSFTECPAAGGYTQETAYATTAITFKVGQNSKYSYSDVESVNQIDVIDVACEEYVQEVLRFLEIHKSGNLTHPIISFSSPSFNPYEGSDFILEEIETFLRTPDELSNSDDDYYDTEGDILYLEKLLNDDPSLNLPPVKTKLEFVQLR